MKYKHLFGPVNSRRLGISLGVDMMPHKTCTLDCVYCECGSTSELTTERKEYISAEEITRELHEFLSAQPRLDYVTFGGSGEPTLNTALGKCIRFVKSNFPQYKTALLTNGTLFTHPDVREDSLLCDMVLPSVDAISDNAFNQINRPHQSLDNGSILDGLVEFSKSYTGKLMVEVFIIPGINDNPEELTNFKKALEKINLTRVQLNSLDRPGACDWVEVATAETLLKIAEFFAPLPVEIISRNSSTPIMKENTGMATEESILTLLKRRPSTIEELSRITGLTINIVQQYLSELQNKGQVSSESISGNTFYHL